MSDFPAVGVLHSSNDVNFQIFQIKVYFELNFADVQVDIIACLYVHAGAWLKSNWGHVRREGNQLILTYIAPQLGYWLAAMSPLHSGEKLISY